MKRLWTLLPIVAAAFAVLWMALISSRSALELARESWDARSFTGYHAIIRYYDSNQNCTHDLIVEDEEVVSAQLTGDCEPLIEGVEHPTITELMDYLAGEQARFEAEGECDEAYSHRRMTITGRYDREFGFPRSVSLGATYFSGSIGVTCPSTMLEWVTIEVVSFIPS